MTALTAARIIIRETWRITLIITAIGICSTIGALIGAGGYFFYIVVNSP